MDLYYISKLLFLYQRVLYPCPILKIRGIMPQHILVGNHGNTMKNFITKCVILTLFCSNIVATAWAQDVQLLPDTNTAQRSVDQYILPNTTLQRDYCPAVENLVKDPEDQTWSADGGWESNAPSFINKLTSFVGAQWVGVSVGEIICLYARSGRAEFPVALQRRTLVPAPRVGGLWSEDKGGYRECLSADIHSCPFFIQVPLPPKDIYEELDFFKGKPIEAN